MNDAMWLTRTEGSCLHNVYNIAEKPLNERSRNKKNRHIFEAKQTKEITRTIKKKDLNKLYKIPAGRLKTYEGVLFARHITEMNNNSNKPNNNNKKERWTHSYGTMRSTKTSKQSLWKREFDFCWNLRAWKTIVLPCFDFGHIRISENQRWTEIRFSGLTIAVG